MPVLSRARRLAALPVLLVAVLLASLFMTAGSASAMTRAQRIGYGWQIARHQIGDPYVYGAAGPNSFDCSGLVYYSFHKAGFRHLPRTASAQAGFANRIHKGQLRRGDLVFFYSGSATARSVYHVGIFAGWRHHHRTIVHAPRPGERVHRERIWTSRWFAGSLRGV